MYKLLFFAITFFVASNELLAGGFQVNLLGVRQIAMGHTGTAMNGTASSLVFNPGAIYFTDHKLDVEVGGSFIFSEAGFKFADTKEVFTTDNPMSTPFSAFVTFKSDKKYAIGLGIYTPFGSTIDWGEDWRRRDLIQKISLQSIFIQPTFNYAISENVGIGLGLVAAYGSVELNRAIPQASLETTTELSGDTWGMGFNIGLFAKVSDHARLGISYRSKIEMNVEGGEASFLNTPTATLGTIFPISGETTFDTQLPLPGSLNFGLGVDVSQKLLYQFDINWIQWSAYESLDFDFKDLPEDSNNEKNFNDAIIIRMGAEYSATERLRIQAGGYYDVAPSTSQYWSPETPDSDRIGLSFGVGIDFSERVTGQFSYLHLIGKERFINNEEIGLEGSVKSISSIPSLSINYHL